MSILLGIILLTLSGLFLVSPAVSAAAQASFIWDPNIEPDIGGYRIYCREQIQPYSYATVSWEGAETEGTAYDLIEGTAYCCVVRAFDIEGYESDDSNEVCFETSGIINHAPRADAGPDQLVNEGQSVLLNGSNSIDDDDGIASYQWVQTGGPEVLLSDPDAAQLNFTAPDIGVEGAALTFELTVTDIAGNQGQDTCVVNVTWQNEPPQANAGNDQTVDEGVMVSLDGSSSVDIDDGIVSYEWDQVGYPTVSLSNASTPSPTFTAPPVGTDGLSLTFNLVVTDVGGLKSTDTCIVNITWQNEAPSAVIVPDYLEKTGESLVTLDGSASTDPDDGIASYLWTQVEGDPVTFSNPTSAITSFTTPATEALDKNIELRLTVTDQGGLKDTADSTIYVMQNEPPTLSSVTITGSSQVNESSDAQYILTANYSDGSSTEVTGFASWNDNSSYASINSSGYLTASSVVSDQSCTISASYEGQSDTHNVTIKDVPPTLTSVTITGSSQVNESSGAQYILTANYSDGSSSEVTGVASWSDNTSYASISSNGYLTIGSVASDQSFTITAIYEGKSDTYTVTIEDVPPTLTSVTISGPAHIDENSGAQYILTANYSDGSSSEVTGVANWSDNSSYASINSSGFFIASSVASDQSCTMTASYEGKSDTYTVTIEDVPPTLNSVTISGPSQISENSGAQYILAANYSDGSSSEVTGVASWSDNTSYASISSNGYLTIGSVASDQSCTIAAIYEGKSDTYNVTIEDAPANQPPLAGFSWARSRKTIVFNDQSVDNDGSIVAWHWDFGDGKYSTARYPGHRYAKFGTYTVTLTVQDDGGASAFVSKTVSLSRK